VWAAMLRGKHEQAIALLEQEYQEHSGSLILINVDAYPDSIRSDPRFKNLVHRMGLDRSLR